MNFDIEIQKEGFDFERWSFWMNEKGIINIQRYAYLKRPTKRHKGEAVKYYDRIMHRNSNITSEQLPLTEEIKQLAIQHVISKLTVQI